jgi:hypothetical protein
VADTSQLKLKLILGCREAVGRAAQTMVDNARSKVVVRTGHLRDTIEDPVMIRDDEVAITYKIAVTADYAEYVEFDTQEHEIEASNAPLLVFFWENGPNGPGIYKFRKVQHPGTTAQPFFFPTEEEWYEALRFELGVEPLFTLHG